MTRGNIAGNWPNEDQETESSILFGWAESGQLLVFRWVKTALQNRRFADADVTVRALTELFDSVTFEELQSVFQNEFERLEWVIRHNG
jgi:hypothetical protein